MSARFFYVANMAHTAAAITAVASQPTNLSRGLATNFPMTLRLPASSIITMSTGTGPTPARAFAYKKIRTRLMAWIAAERIIGFR